MVETHSDSDYRDNGYGDGGREVEGGRKNSTDSYIKIEAPTTPVN